MGADAEKCKQHALSKIATVEELLLNYYSLEPIEIGGFYSMLHKQKSRQQSRSARTRYHLVLNDFPW